MCRKCSKRDHYAKVCLADSQSKVHQLEEAESESKDYIFIEDLSDKHDRPCPRCIVKIQGTPINVLVYSGSPFRTHRTTVFLLCANCMKAIFPQAVTEVRLLLYKVSQSRLQYKDCSNTDKVYVSKKGATTLELSAQSKLRIVLDPTFMTPYYRHCGSVSRSFGTRQYKSCYTCFTQNTVETGCKPAQHKVRNILLAARPAVAKELQRL